MIGNASMWLCYRWHRLVFMQLDLNAFRFANARKQIFESVFDQIRRTFSRKGTYAVGDLDQFQLFGSGAGEQRSGCRLACGRSRASRAGLGLGGDRRGSPPCSSALSRAGGQLVASVRRFLSVRRFRRLVSVRRFSFGSALGFGSAVLFARDRLGLSQVKQRNGV